MTDPVIGPDGITYERAAIERWLATGNNTSPITRVPMTSNNLIPNYALRSLIEAATGVVDVSGSSVDAEEPNTRPTPPPVSLDVMAAGEGRYHIKISAPDGPAATLPTLFIDVLDISGSMGESSVDTTQQATSDAVMFSRADLVKHSVATQIELLRPQDELAIVLFDERVEVVLEPTRCRRAAKHCLEQITSRGGTDVWRGLLAALQIAARAENADKNIVILLQTDGESDPARNPPRGIAAAFRQWCDAHPRVQFALHTIAYGYGARLDSPLLRELAEVGGGTPNYIPDGSMVGTVFIHLMANLMSCLYNRVVLQIPDVGLTQLVGTLQGGQSRDFIVEAPAGAEVFVKDGSVLLAEAVTGDGVGPIEADTEFQLFRHRLMGALKHSIALGSVCEELTALVAEARGSSVEAIRTLADDLEHADKHKGQVSKALASSDAFTRWGSHYLPGYIAGHAQQWPINFKDVGSEMYGGSYTRDLVQRGDEIFNSLTPPTPSQSRYHRWMNVGWSGAAHTTFNMPAPGAPPPLVPLASMMSIHDRSGGCFLGGTRIRMFDGTEKRASAVQPGDYLAHGYYVRCVLKMSRTDDAHIEVVPTSDKGGITPWHPVYVGGTWQHPAKADGFAKPMFLTTPEPLYNFVLADGHTVIADGVTACTLAHNFTGAVVGHPYFGGRQGHHRNILDDLEASVGWDIGFVHWRNPVFVREGGRVTRVVRA